MRPGGIFMWKLPHYLTQTIRITPLNCSFKRDSTEGHGYWKDGITGHRIGDTETKDNTWPKQNTLSTYGLYQNPHLSKLT